MSFPRDLPATLHGAARDRREMEQTLGMAQHFCQVLIDTGFSEREIALAFMQVGLALSKQMNNRDGIDDAGLCSYFEAI